MRGDLAKREFPGKHDPGEPVLRSPAHAVSIVDRHLGRGMQGEAGQVFPCERGNTGVLHEDRVDADRLEPDEVVQRRRPVPGHG